MHDLLRLGLYITVFSICTHSELAADPPEQYVPTSGHLLAWDYLLKSEHELASQGKDAKQEKQSYDDALSDALTAYGFEGWELVAVFVRPNRHKEEGGIVPEEPCYVFKRRHR